MWEGVGNWTELQHTDPHSYGHQRFFPILLGCSTGGPVSLGAGFLYCILSPTCLIPSWLIRALRAPSAGCWLSLPHLVSISSDPQMINRGPEGSLCWVLAFFTGCWLGSNWLNFLCTELYNSSMATFFLWASQIALIQPIHSQGYTLLFLNRMHLLFTQVHILFWQPARVGGQYTTESSYPFPKTRTITPQAPSISGRIKWFITLLRVLA